MRDDLISRKALLNVVGKIPQSWEYGQAISDVYDIIKSAPTLTLDDLRPKGRWEDKYDGKYANQVYRCSACGARAMHVDNKAWFLPSFCPSCGADMRGGQL